MILHQGDRYVCNGTQVHPGSLNFLKPSLKKRVLRDDCAKSFEKCLYATFENIAQCEKKRQKTNLFETPTLAGSEPAPPRPPPSRGGLAGALNHSSTALVSSNGLDSQR